MGFGFPLWKGNIWNKPNNENNGFCFKPRKYACKNMKEPFRLQTCSRKKWLWQPNIYAVQSLKWCDRPSPQNEVTINLTCFLNCTILRGEDEETWSQKWIKSSNITLPQLSTKETGAKNEWNRPYDKDMPLLSHSFGLPNNEWSAQRGIVVFVTTHVNFVLIIIKIENQ